MIGVENSTTVVLTIQTHPEMNSLALGKIVFGICLRLSAFVRFFFSFWERLTKRYRAIRR